MGSPGRPIKRSGRRKISLLIEHDCEQAAAAFARAQTPKISLSDAVNEALSAFFSVGEQEKERNISQSA